MIALNKLSKEIYEGNKTRGFDVKNENAGQTLMLVVSELAEALEADRKNNRNGLVSFTKSLKYAQLTDVDFTLGGESVDWIKNRFETTIKDTFEDEIADALIRILDLCGGFDIDIERHVELKLKYNATREYKHGKAY